jgi:uncharacterized tellurite resistance protein B-like protein
MVTAIKKFFDKHIKPSPNSSSDGISEHSIQLATTALLVEMMKADTEVSDEERKAVVKTIQSQFHLNEEETNELLHVAEDQIQKATGYFEFTSLINKGLAYEQKVKVIGHLWEIAFADSHLDKHEEHMVRKIAGLIYVEHKDFIDAKLRVKKKLGL